MAKAHIITRDGSKVTIEGSQEEVAALITHFEGYGKRGKEPLAKPTSRHQSKGKPNLLDLIAELIDGGFFKKPKELGAVKRALEEQGHFYPVTTLSPTLLRLVRKKTLRRIKEDKRWLYTG